MSNTRFLLTNQLQLDHNPLVLLKNGTGGGAPALIESAPYTMSNLVYGDRYTLWKSSTLTVAQYNVDFDMGAAVTIDTVGFLGTRLLSGAVPVTIDAFLQTGAYTPGGTWTFVGSPVSFAQRDGWASITSFPNARSVRFTITANVTCTISIGKFMAGQRVDLGGIHSPGGTRTPRLNRLDVPLPCGAIVTTVLGDPGMSFTLPWRSAGQTVRDTLNTVQQRNGSVVLLDWEDRVTECIVDGASITETKGFSNSWDIDVSLTRLP